MIRLMEQSTLNRLNLVTIQLFDPFIQDVVKAGSNVELFVFNFNDKKWCQSDVRGQIFVYTRSASPYHCIFIYNQFTKLGFIEPIDAVMVLLSEPKLLMYKKTRFQFCAIAFLSTDERNEFELLLRSIMNSQLYNRCAVPQPNSGVNSYNYGREDDFDITMKAAQALRHFVNEISVKMQVNNLPLTDETPYDISAKYWNEKNKSNVSNLSANDNYNESQSWYWPLSAEDGAGCTSADASNYASGKLLNTSLTAKVTNLGSCADKTYDINLRHLWPPTDQSHEFPAFTYPDFRKRSENTFNIKPATQLSKPLCFSYFSTPDELASHQAKKTNNFINNLAERTAAAIIPNAELTKNSDLWKQWVSTDKDFLNARTLAVPPKINKNGLSQLPAAKATDTKTEPPVSDQPKPFYSVNPSNPSNKIYYTNNQSVNNNPRQFRNKYFAHASQPCMVERSEDAHFHRFINRTNSNANNIANGAANHLPGAAEEHHKQFNNKNKNYNHVCGRSEQQQHERGPNNYRKFRNYSVGNNNGGTGENVSCNVSGNGNGNGSSNSHSGGNSNSCDNGNTAGNGNRNGNRQQRPRKWYGHNNFYHYNNYRGNNNRTHSGAYAQTCSNATNNRTHSGASAQTCSNATNNNAGSDGNRSNTVSHGNQSNRGSDDHHNNAKNGTNGINGVNVTNVPKINNVKY